MKYIHIAYKNFLDMKIPIAIPVASRIIEIIDDENT